MNDENVRNQLIQGAHVLAEREMATAFGHISARVGDAAFVITPPKPPVSLKSAEDLIEVSLKKAHMPAGVPGEAWIHWSIYRRRPEVMSVCRAQPEFPGIMASAGVPIRPVHGHGAFLDKEIPIYDSVELIRSEELGERLADCLGKASAVIIRGTGSVTVGSSVSEAVALMWALEKSAKMNLFSRLAGEPKLLDSEEVSDWWSKRKELLGRLWEYLRLSR